MREFIQSKLEEITSVETGLELPDDVLEKNKTYFSFQVNKNFVNSDTDNKFTYDVNIIGYVKRLIDTTENTLEIVDTAVLDIISKLKEINIRCSSNDVSIENGVHKIRITGIGHYNEINNTLV